MVKVRVGYGLGTRTPTLDGPRFGDLVDALEDLRFDSLWLSERISGPCPDPLIGLAYAAARSTKLKLGTSVQVLPGRNPYLLAKEWASLDRLSGGRTLPAFGLGVADPREQAAFGVDRKARAGLFDEALPKVRRLWLGEEVDGVRIEPLPVQSPPEVWLGGIAPSELRRCGRFGDGWLPSFCTPDDVRRGIQAITETAEQAGRQIDPEHFGALLPYTDGPIPELVAAGIARRRPDVDPAEVVAVGLDGLRRMIARHIEAGGSKFVIVPVAEPVSWGDHLAEVAEAVLPIQT